MNKINNYKSIKYFLYSNNEAEEGKNKLNVKIIKKTYKNKK